MEHIFNREKNQSTDKGKFIEEFTRKKQESPL